MTIPLLIFFLLSTIATYVFAKFIIKFSINLTSKELNDYWLRTTLFPITLTTATFLVYMEIINLKEYMLLNTAIVVFFVDFKVKYFRRNYINSKYMSSIGTSIQEAKYFNLDLLFADLKKDKKINLGQLEVEFKEEGDGKKIIEITIFSKKDTIFPYQFHKYEEQMTVLSGKVIVNDKTYYEGEIVIVKPFQIHNLIMTQGDFVTVSFFESNIKF